MWINARGYVMFRMDGRDKLIHRHVMEAYLGRPLTVDEVVHHKDGNRLNNQLDNLEIMYQGDHARRHLKRMDVLRGRKGQSKGIPTIAFCIVCPRFFIKPSCRRSRTCSRYCQVRLGWQRRARVPHR